MDQWEYYSLFISWDEEQKKWKGWRVTDNHLLPGEIVPEFLNQIGLDGWELVSVLADHYKRANWIDFTYPVNSALGNTSPTEWGITRYRAFFKREKP